MDTVVIFQQMLILVLLLAVGFTIRRLKVIDDSANTVMMKLLLRVTVPATLIYAIVNPRQPFEVQPSYVPQSLFWIVLSFVIVGGLSWLAPILMRAKKEEHGAYLNMGHYGNVNFMSIPLIIALIGAYVLPNDSMVHAILYNIVFNLTIFSLGMKLIGGKEAKVNAKLFFSPVMIGGMLALLFFVIGLRVPGPELRDTVFGFFMYVTFRPVGFLGAMTAPLSMLLLGSILGGMKMGDMFRGWRIYVITAVRLIVAPILIWLVLMPFNLDPVLMQVIVIMNASPMAISVAMFTINYNKHKEIVAQGIFISTLLSVVTMPLIMWLLPIF